MDLKKSNEKRRVRVKLENQLSLLLQETLFEGLCLRMSMGDGDAWGGEGSGS